MIRGLPWIVAVALAVGACDSHADSGQTVEVKPVVQDARPLPSTPYPKFVHTRSDQYRTSLDALAGDIYGDYLGPPWPLSRAIISGLGGTPDNDRILPGGLTLVSGCRRHSCVEKAAVLLDAESRVRIAALIHFNCSEAARAVREGSPCRAEPLLAVVYGTDEDARHLQTIVNWAKEKDPRLTDVIVNRP